MLRKVDVEFVKHKEVFANPAPLGLLGLAIACAALVPISFGIGVNPNGFKTAAVFALLFGAGCQMLCGLMEFANKNTYGGTIFTTFAFNWIVNYLVLSNTVVCDHHILIAVDATMLVIFSALTYGFGFFSALLFYFLLDIDLIYVCKLINGITGMPTLLMVPIGIGTAIMGLIALWIALAALINPVAGREIFKVKGPIFFAPKKTRFDFSVRFNIFDTLYKFWKEHAYKEMKFEELQAKVKDATGVTNISPDLFYLNELGYVTLNHDVYDKEKIMSLRLSAHGIDLHEQWVLKKYDWN